MSADREQRFVDYALEQELVSAEQVEECRRIQRKEQEQGRRYSIGQILIRRRYLSCGDFLDIENGIGEQLYECARCKTRYGRDEVPESGALTCKGCGERVGVGVPELSQVEILAARDPRQLALVLVPIDQKKIPTNDGETIIVPEIVKARSSSRARAEVAPPEKQESSRRSKTRLSKAALAFDKSQLAGLSRYEVLDEIGRGGMGIVFKARQIDIDRVCALKVITAGPTVPEVQINRFVQEARSAAQLSHPNIVTIYDSGRHRDMFYIAMEFIRGKALSGLIHDDPGLPIERALAVEEDLLDALQYAHDHGVVHRDLKPANVIVEDESGRARLIDFGLAKDHGSDLGLTQTGQILGSPFYLSPEQTRGESRDVDARSDVFALGVILYEMLTKARPFTGRSAAEVYAKILKERPAPPTALVPDIDADLQAIVLRALEKRPEDRFQSAREMKAAIRDYRTSRSSAEMMATQSSKGRVKSAPRVKAMSARSSGVAPRRSSERDRTTTVSMRRPVSEPRGPLRAIAAMVAVLGAIGVAVAVASSGPSRDHDTAVSSTPTPAPTPTPTPSNPDTPSTPDAPVTPTPPALDSARALREVEAAVAASPTDWGTQVAQWRDLLDRFPSLAERAKKEIDAAQEKSREEAGRLIGLSEVMIAKGKLGEAASSLDRAAPRFAGTDGGDRLRERAQKIDEDARARSRATIADVDSALATKDYEAAARALGKWDRTGIQDADGPVDERRRALEEALARKRDAARAAIAAASETCRKRCEPALQLFRDRRYREALDKLDDVAKTPELARVIPDEIAQIRSDLSLVVRVIDGARKPGPKATGLEIDLGKGVKGKVAGVENGAVLIELKGGGKAEHDLSTLPPQSVIQLYATNDDAATPIGWLARAVFLLVEGEVEAARAAFEQAKKKKADVSDFEERFAEADKLARAARRARGLSSGDGEEKTGSAKDAPKAIKDDMQMVQIAAGEFAMGRDQVDDESRADETPAHRVRLGAYWLDRFEVSNRQYSVFLDWIAKNPQKAHSHCHSDEPAGKDHVPLAWKAARFGGDPYPVVGVDWFDAFAYSRWARKRLPTEAEWERGARGTDGRAFPWGAAFEPLKCLCPESLFKKSVATDDAWKEFEDWVRATAPRLTMPVNSFPEGRSPSGAYNMAGNVAEWVADWHDDRWYDACRTQGLMKDPIGPERGKLRVVRGGAWAARSPALYETTSRLAVDPTTRRLWLGFRCAREGE